MAWAFVLVCLYQLSYTFVTSAVNRKAKKAAEAYAASETTKIRAAQLANNDELATQVKLDSIKDAFEAHYLDSMANEKVYLGSTYRQCQGREINLGLDLKGGMNVMLEVSTADVVRSLAHKDIPDNGLFESAMEAAIARQKVTTNEDFVSLFYKEIVRINKETNDGKELFLAPYFNGPKLPNIKATDKNDKVISELRDATRSAYEMTYERLRQRIDKFGVAQPTIQKLEASERILVELPGVKEPERVRKLLQSTAQLEFWRTYDNADEYGYKTLDKINSSLAAIGTSAPVQDSVADVDAETVEEEVSGDSALIDQLSVNADADENSVSQQDIEKANPLFARLMPSIERDGRLAKGPVVGLARRSDRDAINELLSIAAEKHWYDTRRVKYLWSAKPLKDNQDIYQLYAIAVENDGNPVLGGDVITDARQDFSQVGGNEISMTMNTEGARDWKQITGANVGKCIAIVMDNVVYSAPVVNGEIAGGRSSITGDFTLDEAKDLANILKSGKLEAPAIIVQEAVVGPSLGQESITRGLISFILAFVVVLIYMVIFYNRAGWVSVVALITNVFLLIGILASIGSVLTLPGIAGIVLTMAMAVDGNVIIYERVKEELRNGSSVANAVDAGFKNAYSAIIDGQVTTFLLGLVLIMFGSGPVRGFAVTLCIGIVTSLFTSIFITRLVIDNLLRARKNMTFSYPFSADFMRNVHIDFIGKRKVFYIIMGCAILVCVCGFVFRGLSFGIDFSGGRTYVVRFDQPVNAVEVRASMNKQFDEAPEVKTYGPSTQLKITTKYKIKEDGDEVKNEIMTKLYEGSKTYFARPITLDEFKSTETNPLGIIQAEQVGGTIAHDNMVHSIWAIIGGLIIIFVYIGLRFRSWRFGLGSVAALTHDTILVIGMFSLLYGLLPFNLDVDQYFISAVLTVIGYSINATVVIFDRVREYRKLYPKRDLMTHMNDAINSTLARTINTSGTTFVTLLMMFIFGGEVIRGFIFALLVGVVCGMFSSVCIACPVVYEISKRKEARKAVVKQ